MRRRSLIIALTCIVALLVGASGARAVVVNDQADQGTKVGVTLVPGGSLPPDVTADITTPSPCDPALAPDLILQSSGLCYHGGAVLQQNETFALTWDQHRAYWTATRNYLEQFLRDAASASGTLGTPYAVTPQYTAQGGSGVYRAGNDSLYGGGCIDFGDVGGSACKFADTSGTGPGHDYPGNGCTPTLPTSTPTPTDSCFVDRQIQAEIQTMVQQTGLLQRTTQGYTPLVVVLLPPTVEACIDTADELCSANTDPAAVKAQFCSYHSHVDVGGTDVAYVVQPWTAGTPCDEPGLAVDKDPSLNAGERLVSPLSAGQLSAVSNPYLDGWYADNGSEISDNGCQPLGPDIDTVTVGSSSQNPYVIQHEFNNGGVIATGDPSSPACAGSVTLSPRFVAPSSVNHGDEVQFDGSTTASTLLVPRLNYSWDFGDGTTAVGPSVVHSYVNGGTYTVKLSVTDRGGNAASASETINVSGPTPPAPTPPPPPPPPVPSLSVHLQLLPQSLSSVLHTGIALNVTANAKADGIASLSISRAAARRAGIPVGHAADVVVARGTVSGIKSGTVRLHLRLSRSTAAKLRRLAHVTVTVRLSLLATGRARVAVVAAGHY